MTEGHSRQPHASVSYFNTMELATRLAGGEVNSAVKRTPSPARSAVCGINGRSNGLSEQLSLMQEALVTGHARAMESLEPILGAARRCEAEVVALQAENRRLRRELFAEGHLNDPSPARPRRLAGRPVIETEELSAASTAAGEEGAPGLHIAPSTHATGADPPRSPPPELPGALLECHVVELGASPSPPVIQVDGGEGSPGCNGNGHSGNHCGSGHVPAGNGHEKGYEHWSGLDPSDGIVRLRKGCSDFGGSQASEVDTERPVDLMRSRSKQPENSDASAIVQAKKAADFDRAAMKDQIKQAILKTPYDVAKYYHPAQESLFTRIATNLVFEHFTLSVIAVNALWISIETDLNTAEVLLNANPIFQIAEHMFCLYFSLEWYIRYKAFKRKRDCVKDGWFVFDSCLVFMMVMETWVMSFFLLVSGNVGGAGMSDASILRMARLLRLTRMARMARLFRAMPELLILIKGMTAAIRSVFFVLCLLAIVIYVFAIAFRQLSDGTEVGAKYFNTVPESMHTLLIDGTLLDSTKALVEDLMAIQEPRALAPILVTLFYLFVLLSALTVLNMLIGVLCEVVSGVAATEKESLTCAYVKSKLEQIIQNSGLDENGDQRISKDELSKIMEIPEASRALYDVGVDVVSLVDNIDFIFADDDGNQDEKKELDFETFMLIILNLRGSNFATRKDIIDLKKDLMGNIVHQRDELQGLSKMMLKLGGACAKGVRNSSDEKSGSMSPCSATGKRGGGSGSRLALPS